MIKKTINIFLLVLPFFSIACGGGSSNNVNESVSSGEEEPVIEEIDSAILEGTPFEGKELGNDLSLSFFLCDQYRTETIDSFPIKVFPAYFTATEEQVVQDAIDIANEGIGFTAYELTDEWDDTNRVIYKVKTLVDIEGIVGSNVVGNARVLMYYFNDHTFSERIVPDWVILIDNLWVDKRVIAHELGHATGLSHYLIDYENNTATDFNDANSLMEPGSLDADLGDYNFMMSMQGQIMQDHLDEVGDILTDQCDSED